MILEHANLNVRNIDATVKFLTTASADYQVRGGGESGGTRWLHVGTDETYIALNEKPELTSEDLGFNHLGFVVDDVDAVSARLLAAGYVESSDASLQQFRKRRYFHDAEKREWEFVEYLSDNRAERNDYSA